MFTPRQPTLAHRFACSLRTIIFCLLTCPGLGIADDNSVAAQRASDTVRLYYNFKRIDPVAEKVIPAAYVVVANNRIQAVGSGAPPVGPFDEAHDMQGHFALPGLIDTHAHVTLGPVTVAVEDGIPQLGVEYDPAITAHNAKGLLAYGVTTIRNPGGDAAINVAYKRDVAAGRLLGPEARVAGPVIDRSATPFEGLADLVSEDRPIEAIVREHAAAGVDDVKLYFSLTAEDLARGQAAAEQYGVGSIGHVGVDWRTAVEIGLDALVHAMPTSPDLLNPEVRDDYLQNRRPGAYEFFEWWEQADLESEPIRDMIATVAASDITIDATLIAFYLAFWGDQPAVRDAYLELAHPKMVQNWQTLFRFDLGWTAADYARAKAVWPKIQTFVKLLHNAGAKLTLGTDQGNPFIAPGASLMQEMILHQQAGLPDYAILRMATSTAAELLGMGQKTGKIAPGYDADMVFLKHNPLEDFKALETATLVLHNGQALEPEVLKAEIKN